jgi:acyl-CoA thioesterase-1
MARSTQAGKPGPGLKGGPLRKIVNGLAAALAALCLILGHSGLAAPAAAASARVLMLGDSLTAGYGLPPADALPAQLQSALKSQGIDVVVLNGGVSGDTTAGGLARLDWALADNPSHALVGLGANDALRGLAPEKAFENLDAIVARLKAKGVKVMILGMLAPPNLGRDYGERFAAIYPRLAEKHAVPLYPFLLDGVAADPKLNQADGIHPNAEGVRAIVARLMPPVRRFLETPG